MISNPTEKTYRRVIVPSILYRKFKKFYPDRGDFQSVVIKLVRFHIEHLERRREDGQIPDPLPPKAA